MVSLRNIGRRLPNRRLPHRSWGLGLLVGLLTLTVGGKLSAGGPAPSDPVAYLRQTLQAPVREGALGAQDLELRRRNLQASGAQITHLPDLREGVLLREWRDDDPDERVNAIDRAAHADLIRHFEQALHDVIWQGDTSSRLAGILMLDEMAGKLRGRNLMGWNLRRFTPDLAKLARDREVALRAAAARALGQINPEPGVAISALASLFESGDVLSRRAAAAGLADEIMNAANALRRPNGQIAAEARADIIQLTRAAIPVACGGLGDPDAEVRRCGIQALHATAVALGKLIDDPRIIAAEDSAEMAAYRREVEEERRALWPIASDLKDQTNGLTGALKDADAGVRLLARNALEEMGTTWMRFEARSSSVAVIVPVVLNKVSDRQGGPGIPRSSSAQIPVPANGSATQGGTIIPPAQNGDLVFPPSGSMRTNDSRGSIAQADPPDASKNVNDAKRANLPLQERLRAAVPALANGISDPDVVARRTAIDVLEVLGDDAAPATPALVKALCDRDLFVRWAAARTLGKLNEFDAASVIPGLVQLIHDPDLDVRLVATDALGKHGPVAKDAVPALAQAVGRGDSIMRMAAIQTLQGIGPAAQPAIPQLTSALDNSDPRVRQAAATALGTFGGAAAGAKESLRRLLSDVDPEVRRAASEALLEMTPSPGAAPALENWQPTARRYPASASERDIPAAPADQEHFTWINPAAPATAINAVAWRTDEPVAVAPGAGDTQTTIVPIPPLGPMPSARPISLRDSVKLLAPLKSSNP